MGTIGNVLSGAGGGALAGGALGPAGAIAGGLLGGLGGFFGGNGESDEQRRLREQAQLAYQNTNNRPAFQMGPAAQSGQSGFAPQQQTLADMLFAMSRGEGPSLAGEQLRAGADRAAGTQAGMAAGAAGRGVNSGAAYLNAANNAGAAQAQANQDAGMARVQEQLGAMGQLGGVLGQGRAMDQQNSQFNANAQNQTALANLQALLEGRQLDDATRASLLQLQQNLLTQGKGPSVGDTLLAGGGTFAAMGLGNYAPKQAGSTGYQSFTNPAAGPKY